MEMAELCRLLEEYEEAEREVEQLKKVIERDKNISDALMKIARRLEEASHGLQFCEDAADVASILVDLFNEIAEMLKGWG